MEYDAVFEIREVWMCRQTSGQMKIRVKEGRKERRGLILRFIFL